MSVVGSETDKEALSASDGEQTEEMLRYRTLVVSTMINCFERRETKRIERIIQSYPSLLNDKCFEGRTIAHAVLLLGDPSMINAVFKPAAAIEHKSDFVEDYLETLKVFHNTQKMSMSLRHCARYIDQENPYHLLCSYEFIMD